MHRIARLFGWRLLLLAVGVVLIVGCDAQTQSTVEDGVISASSSLFGAVLQAIIAVVSAQATAILPF